MNIEWLADFIVLSETGNFSRAAEKRAVTHTAFGRRIKLLEEWVGAKLIERTQPAKLTSEGKIFLAVAKDITADLDSVRMQFRDGGSRSQKAVTVATGRTLGSKFFPHWYREVLAETGFIRMSIVTGGAGRTIQQFTDKQADLLLVYQTPMTDTLRAKSEFSHKIIGRESIVPVTVNPKQTYLDFSTSQRMQMNWLNYDKSLSLRGIVLPMLDKKQILSHLNPVFEADNYDTMKEMVMENVGIAWLPLSTVQRDIDRGRLFLISNETLQINVNIALYKRIKSSAQLNDLWDKIVEA